MVAEARPDYPTEWATMNTVATKLGIVYVAFVVDVYSRAIVGWAAGIDASIGTVGDALDNALMESQIGLYKTELIKRRGTWRSLADVELATAEWADWFNATRPHSAIGHLPPEEYETLYYAQHQLDEPVGINR
ncbi:hypothetical protein GCM10010517_27820 [Streptosporangium fragile]|uniref:Integrase catalytic domain-containing protein n=1 Tax=Streptosporangium fragile TaxID=46186 RepID=A0ABP6IC49_9ACTN